MKRIINNVLIETKKKEFIQANILEVEVGTNGFHGGDTGHGSRTFFAIKDLGSTDIKIEVQNSGVVFKLGGDSELTTFLQALHFATKTLTEQIKQLEETKKND